jgi:hypothetical protein
LPLRDTTIIATGKSWFSRPGHRGFVSMDGSGISKMPGIVEMTRVHRGLLVPAGAEVIDSLRDDVGAGTKATEGHLMLIAFTCH